MSFYPQDPIRTCLATVLGALLLLTATVVAAQENTVNPALGLDDATITGELDSREWQSVQEFLRTRDPDLLHPEVHWESPLTGARASGELEADSFFLPTVAETTSIDVSSLFIGENVVVVQFLFRGEVRDQVRNVYSLPDNLSLPAVAVFHVDDEGKITRVYVYYDVRRLPDDTRGATNDIENVHVSETDLASATALLDEVTDEPAGFIGQTVTVAGTFDQIVGGDIQNGFIIVEEDLVGDDPLLVFGETPQLLQSFAWQQGALVRVTGRVTSLHTVLDHDILDYPLDETLYGEWTIDDRWDDEDEIEAVFPVIVASDLALVQQVG